MKNVLTPHILVLAALAGWLNREQQKVLEFLREENRILREQLGGRRLRLSDDDRRGLAVRGKEIGRRLLDEFATLVTPDTILRWHRQLVARKWTTKAGAGCPGVMKAIEDLAVPRCASPGWLEAAAGRRSQHDRRRALTARKGSRPARSSPAGRLA